jgi:hypothetical protein
MDKTNNAELLVVQAMIHTAWIAFDPMTNGQKLSGTVMHYMAAMLQKIKSIYNKAEFEIGSAKFWELIPSQSN